MNKQRCGCTLYLVRSSVGVSVARRDVLAYVHRSHSSRRFHTVCGYHCELLYTDMAIIGLVRVPTVYNIQVEYTRYCLRGPLDLRSACLCLSCSSARRGCILAETIRSRLPGCTKDSISTSYALSIYTSVAQSPWTPPRICPGWRLHLTRALRDEGPKAA